MDIVSSRRRTAGTDAQRRGALGIRAKLTSVLEICYDVPKQYVSMQAPPPGTRTPLLVHSTIVYARKRRRLRRRQSSREVGVFELNPPPLGTSTLEFPPSLYNTHVPHKFYGLDFKKIDARK